jgi:predicted O-methyltransferase YrrM
MNHSQIQNTPSIYPLIQAKSEAIGFTMPSDIYIGTLLKALVGSKPFGNFLELGTGIGLSLAWMVDGMDDSSQLVSIDNDPKLTKIVSEWFGLDHRISILCEDGGTWIKNYLGESFDLIFADAWPGKYSELDETLALLKIGGIYVIDDMNPQPNWPEGHAEKAEKLMGILESKPNFHLVKMDWSTGVILMTRAN